jgi:aminocarboxymuconate-semialdehyde decarboxylase
MRIDVHAHHYPAEYIEMLIALGRTDINPRASHPDDLSHRIARQDAAGIHRQVLSPIGLDTIIADRRGATRAARCVNDAYAAILTRYSGRFQAFGWVPLPYTGEAILEAARCMDDLGFAGIGLACSYQDRTLDDPAFEEFWAELDRRSAIAYIHPVGRHSRCHWGMDRYTLDVLVGSPNQETIAASRLVYSGVTRRYPNIRFVLAGCGGTLPLLWEVHESLLKSAFGPGMSLQSWVRDTGLSPSDPMAAFRGFWADTANQGSTMLLGAAAAKFGADRLLLGSDSPHGGEGDAVSQIRDCAVLTDAQKRAILDENAQQLFAGPTGKPRDEPPDDQSKKAENGEGNGKQGNPPGRDGSRAVDRLSGRGSATAA